MNLDELYGKVREPYMEVKEAEKRCKPRSMQILDKETANVLKTHMDAYQKLHITNIVHQHVPILWIIRASGEIVFAVEEVVELPDWTHCNLYTGQLNDNEQKLGHPSLTNDEEFKARIGGEILIDDNIWIITNKSGRYCRPADTTKAHLNNVSASFAKYGIVLTPNFRLRAR